MTYVSRFFTKAEVQCKCGKCGFDTISVITLEAADALREWYGKPIIPTSVCRCVVHNKKIGGAKASYHLPHYRGRLKNGLPVFESKAMDLPVDDPAEAGRWLDKHKKHISWIAYKTFIHIDCRENRYTFIHNPTNLGNQRAR